MKTSPNLMQVTLQGMAAVSNQILSLVLHFWYARSVLLLCISNQLSACLPCCTLSWKEKSYYVNSITLKNNPTKENENNKTHAFWGTWEIFIEVYLDFYLYWNASFIVLQSQWAVEPQNSIGTKSGPNTLKAPALMYLAKCHLQVEKTWFTNPSKLPVTEWNASALLHWQACKIL